jgi:hypothetical protein
LYYKVLSNCLIKLRKRLVEIRKGRSKNFKKMFGLKRTTSYIYENSSGCQQVKNCHKLADGLLKKTCQDCTKWNIYCFLLEMYIFHAKFTSNLAPRSKLEFVQHAISKVRLYILIFIRSIYKLLWNKILACVLNSFNVWWKLVNHITSFSSFFFTDERRIVYVGMLYSLCISEFYRILIVYASTGRIENELTKDELKQKFVVYGEIKQVTLHFKDSG